MQGIQPFRLRNQTLCLSSERSVYWEEQNTLIVSDLHFGKTGHFRKAGIAVPQSVFKEDIQRLVAQIQFFKPSTLIVVGDMFHSRANKELEWFSRWRADFENLRLMLVKGNHDILERRWYESAGIEVHERTLKIDEFCFQHDAGDCREDENDDASGSHYVFSGHVHPGVLMSGMGRQSLRFPCFHFTDAYCILPAFSRFTGTVNVRPSKSDHTFAIVNNSLIRVG